MNLNEIEENEIKGGDYMRKVNIKKSNTKKKHG